MTEVSILFDKFEKYPLIENLAFFPPNTQPRLIHIIDLAL